MEIFFFYCIWNFHADEELYVSSLGGIVDVKYTVCLFICFLIGNFFFSFFFGPHRYPNLEPPIITLSHPFITRAMPQGLFVSSLIFWWLSKNAVRWIL